MKSIYRLTLPDCICTNDQLLPVPGILATAIGPRMQERRYFSIPVPQSLLPGAAIAKDLFVLVPNQVPLNQKMKLPDYNKKTFPVAEARVYLEPAPAVLLSSFYKGKSNIMVMGWYTILEFTPSLIGCMISAGNYSFDLIKKSKACVINIPAIELAKTVVKIGNCSGRDTDKFEKFGLTPQKASKVPAPLIKDCFANFECRLYDQKLVASYNFFIMEIVEAHVARKPKYPQTIHYRGNSVFMCSGKQIRIPSLK
ncbi:MAG TPA: flavin reductase family protein [Niabella sp.]